MVSDAFCCQIGGAWVVHNWVSVNGEPYHCERCGKRMVGDLVALASPPAGGIPAEADPLDLNTIHTPEGPLTPLCPPEHREQAAEIERLRAELQSERSRRREDRAAVIEHTKAVERVRTAFPDLLPGWDDPLDDRLWEVACGRAMRLETELQREREEKDEWQRAYGVARDLREVAWTRLGAAEQRIRELEGEIDRQHTLYVDAAEDKCRAERERDSARADREALQGALEEIQSACRDSGYGPGWTAFKIASHALAASRGGNGT